MEFSVGSLKEHGLTLTHRPLPAGISSAGAYRLMVITEGQGTLSLCGRVCGVCPSSVLLAAPHDLLYIPPSAAPHLDAFLFTFTPEALCLFDVPLLSAYSGEPYRTPADMPKELPAQLARLRQIGECPDSVAVPMARLMLTEILLRLSAAPVERDTSGSVYRAARYLAEHLREDVTLDELSREAGISKFYLCRAFDRDSGLTPHAYLNCLRAYRARELLRYGMSAADAGRAVGFSDYSTFFRTYRKIIGVTPTASAEDEADT